MKTKIRFGEKVDAEIVSNNNLLNHIHDRLKVSSVWDWEHWRDGKLIDTWTDHNLAPNFATPRAQQCFWNRRKR